MSRRQEFKHDFPGSEGPKTGRQYFSSATFSIGIFQWLPYALGGRKGLKKSAVKYRVKGYTVNLGPVYKRAEEICDEFDVMYEEDPLWMGPYKKSEIVRTRKENYSNG